MRTILLVKFMVFDPLFAVRLWCSSWNWYSPNEFILGVKNLCLADEKI